MIEPREHRIDPEVLADLQLRAASEHDTSRSRGTTAPMGSWPPVFVVDWKCRNPRCEAGVPVTGDVVERLAIFNEHLRQRGERPIPHDAVLVCEEHHAELRAWRDRKLRERTDALADVIRQLKASSAPAKEAALIARLSELGHPEPHLLMAALDAKSRGGKRRGAM